MTDSDQPRLMGEPPRLRAARYGLAVVFVVAGVGKLTSPLFAPLVLPGAPTFGDVLASLGVPLPYVTAPVVSVVELVGGLTLLAGRQPWMAVASVVLAVDMMVALATLSLPSTFVQPIVVNGLTLGNELWRLPLELGALVGVLLVGRPWELMARRSV